MSRRRRLSRLVDSGEQIDLPCRYCSAPTPMTKHLIQELHAMATKTIVARGEKMIQRDEVAVCPDCRPLYEEQFCPQTIVIEIKKANVDSAFTPQEDDSPDGFGPPD